MKTLNYYGEEEITYDLIRRMIDDHSEIPDNSPTNQSLILIRALDDKIQRGYHPDDRMNKDERIKQIVEWLNEWPKNANKLLPEWETVAE